jgi:hypothetical protein
MARLGALMLTSVLLGLPRLFRAESTVPRRRSRYVEPATCDAALLDFVAQLGPAIDAHCHSLADAGDAGTTVVEVHRLSSQRACADRPAVEAISVSVEAGGAVQRLVLHGPAGRRAGAARTLVRWLTGLRPEDGRASLPREILRH